MNLSEELIKEIVAKVCENMKNEDAMPFERNVLSNGMMSIKTETVKCEPFPFDIGAVPMRSFATRIMAAMIPQRSSTTIPMCAEC